MCFEVRAVAGGYLPPSSSIRQIIAVHHHRIKTFRKNDAGVNSILRRKVAHGTASFHVNWIAITKGLNSWRNKLRIMVEQSSNSDWNVDSLTMEVLFNGFGKVLNPLHHRLLNILRNSEDSWILTNLPNGFRYW